MARSLFRNSSRHGRVEAVDGHVAAGRDAGQQVGAGLDAVGDDLVNGAVQLVAALDRDRAAARPVYVGAHRHEELGEIDDLGLAGGVVDHGGAAGGRRRHEEVLGRPDAGIVERHDGAPQPVAGDLDETVLDLDGGAQPLQAANVKVDAPRTDVAAAGHGDRRPAKTGDHRSHDDDAGSHAPHELVGGALVQPARGIDAQLAVVEGHLGAERAQHVDHGEHVGDARHAADGRRLLGQQAGRHQLESGVLGAGQDDLALEPATAAHEQRAPLVVDLVHAGTGTLSDRSWPPRLRHVRAATLSRFSARRSACSAL